MDLSFIAVQILTGLASASSLFIIASGLTLVFGVTRIVNFAHGSFYMLGAYMGVTLIPWFLDVEASLPLFVAGVVAASLCVGLMGVVLEVTLLRRIYHVPELFQLLATFGVVLIVQDLVVKIFGPADILGPRAPGLRQAVDIFGQRFPAYELFMIVIGIVVFAGLWLLMQRTRFGILVRAARQDREMVAALGVNQAWLFTLTLFLGAALAGLGGALQVPRMAANSHMDVSIIAEAFVITVIGGMGSVSGAALAAILIGLLQAFGVLIFPQITLVLVFLAMGLVLVVRPHGLLGREEASASRVVLPEGILELRRPGRSMQLGFAGLLLVLFAVPLVTDAAGIKLGIEILCFALAAFALQFLVSVGGIVSFGHAAWFGVGAYAAGLFTLKLSLPVLASIALAVPVTALMAAFFGLFVVRLSGIYCAMLTLAVAQTLYAVSFQWVELTGGDNGLVGLWPPAWADGRAYYLLTLALTSLAGLVLWRIIHSPFGFALRAERDSALRAAAIGFDGYRLRLVAFALSGGLTGLAGALYAFSKGSIDPSLLSIPMSVDFLAMMLMGGIQTVTGAIFGAGVLHLLKDAIMPLTDFWRLVMGLVILLLVLAFPRGIIGTLAAWRRR